MAPLYERQKPMKQMIGLLKKLGVCWFTGERWCSPDLAAEDGLRDLNGVPMGMLILCLGMISR